MSSAAKLLRRGPLAWLCDTGIAGANGLLPAALPRPGAPGRAPPRPESRLSASRRPLFAPRRPPRCARRSPLRRPSLPSAHPRRPINGEPSTLQCMDGEYLTKVICSSNTPQTRSFSLTHKPL